MMRSWVALVTTVLVLLSSGAARADIFTAAAIAGAVGDTVTTEIGLHRGFTERNIQQRAPRIAASMLLTGTCILAAKHYEKEGHKGWAKVLKLVPAVVFGGAAIHNAIVMKKGLPR